MVEREIGGLHKAPSHQKFPHGARVFHRKHMSPLKGDQKLVAAPVVFQQFRAILGQHHSVCLFFFPGELSCKTLVSIRVCSALSVPPNLPFFIAIFHEQAQVYSQPVMFKKLSSNVKIVL